MSVAVLADIHANITALEAVLADIRKEGVHQLVLLGDFVGYYYEPRAVIEALSGFDCIAIRGNHDRMALEAREDERLLESYRARYGSGLDAVFDQFGPAEWDWLERLPETRRLDLAMHRILLAHGAPHDPDAYIYPDAGADVFERLGASTQADADALWLGHTHYPFVRAGAPLVMNPGSVGQPRDIGGMASWAIFHPETGAIAMRRAQFETLSLAQQCAQRDPSHARLSDVLSRRRLQVAA